MTHEHEPNAEANAPEVDDRLPPAGSVPVVPSAADLVWPEPMEVP